MRLIYLTRSKWVRWLVYTLVAVAAGLVLSRHSLSRNDTNGFELVDPAVPRETIHHGGPPRDGIPAIDEPRFVGAGKAAFIESGDRILGLRYRGVTRAYPIKILNYHEIVNDRIAGEALIITYCPLCGSGMAFAPPPGRASLSFGVSGLLYNSDMLLYDRQTESLWSQIMGRAISGPLKGKRLRPLVLTHTSWDRWRQQHPETQVLSMQTGYRRDYQRHPYGDYDQDGAVYFPLRHRSARYHPKERVIGLTIGERHKAYPVSELEKSGKRIIDDNIGGQQVSVEYDPASQSATVRDESGRPLPATSMFWFAWYAFHPQTAVFTAASAAD